MTSETDSSKDLRSELAAERGERVRLQWLLGALYDTASDIAATPDLEEVLAAIVQRTRVMTGSDMSYLSLNDHEVGETFIRKSDGVRSEEYKAIRMPLGTGVLGKAATGLSIVSTADYLSDANLVHLSHIDRIVALEGVKSILGVPMIVYGRVRGALLIADREPVEYPPETVEIVDMVARQAAVAIDHAVRLARVTSALEDLDEHTAAVSQRVRTLETALDLDRRMSDIVVQRAGTEPILALVSSVYGSPVSMLFPRDVPNDPVLTAALESIAEARLPAPVTIDGETATVAPVSVGDRHFAWLVVQGMVPADSRATLERAALNLAMALLMDQIEAAAETRSQLELFHGLSEGRLQLDSSTIRRLSDIGIDAGKTSWLVSIASNGDSQALVAAARRTIPGPVLVAPHGAHLCLIHQQKDSFAQSMKTILAKGGVHPRIATARVERLDELPRAHRSSEIALATLRLLGGSILDADSLGLVGALLEAESRGELPYGVEAPALALIEHDADSGADLVRTAWTWMEFGQGITSVADRLMIHPNTLRQRLQRITSLLGEGWDVGARRLEVHLALRSRMLRRELQAVQD